VSKLPVKGAGDEDMRENPGVSSKGMKYHGKPHTPEKVSHPGQTVPMTGTRVAGHTSDGHRLPREVPYAKDEGRVAKPGASRMSGTLGKSQPAELDRGPYSGKYPGDK
jgi:hypothetical protein